MKRISLILALVCVPSVFAQDGARLDMMTVGESGRLAPFTQAPVLLAVSSDRSTVTFDPAVNMDTRICWQAATEPHGRCFSLAQIFR